jgi:hypothetical protein
MTNINVVVGLVVWQWLPPYYKQKQALLAYCYILQKEGTLFSHGRM